MIPTGGRPAGSPPAGSSTGVGPTGPAESREVVPYEPAAAPSAPRTPTSLEPELLREFLEAQREEATVRREELAIRREELQVQRENQRYAHEYSQQALATQKDDRSDGRKARRGQRRDAYLFSGAVVVVIAVVICYALAQGKDAIATEILQTLTTLVVGAGGGYAVGKSKGQAKAGAGEDDE